MQRPLALTFATFVAVPEVRSALAAAEQLAADPRGGPHPLFLHGPAGSGKSHLLSALVERLLSRGPRQAVTHLSVSDWNSLAQRDHDALESARRADLLAVEDVQHLSARGGEALAVVLDERQPRGLPIVLTASAGPRRLGLPERLASRLAGGLVVGLEPLSVTSRLLLLQDKAQRRQLAVPTDVLAWLAQHAATGRQLDGALVQLEALTRASRRPLDLAVVAEHFAQPAKPSVDHIARQVGSYFRVELRQLRSEQRGRHILWPRQVGMYLARRLTGLSLTQIGDYFGGRDHSTVLHACRKVERTLAQDARLSGAVRQLYLNLA